MDTIANPIPAAASLERLPGLPAFSPMPDSPFPGLPRGWIYLTNGCCENSLGHGNEDEDPIFGVAEFDAMGLDHSGIGYIFYPLSDDEARMIGEDHASADGSPSFNMAYTALWRGTKWLAPSAEVCWRTADYPEGPSKEEVTTLCETFVAAARPALAELGGHVFLEYEEGPDADRHDIILAIPMEHATAVSTNFEDWKSRLENLLLNIGHAVQKKPGLHQSDAPDSTSSHALSGQDLATVLAALRYYQEAGMGDPNNRSDDIHEIATDGGQEISLDAEGIDDLCDRLNFDSTPALN